MMNLKEATSVMQHIRKDKVNGVNISSEGEALLTYAFCVWQAYARCEEVALEQADWEFLNHPIQPHARKACEKLANVFSVMAKDEHENQITDPGLPGIEIEAIHE